MAWLNRGQEVGCLGNCYKKILFRVYTHWVPNRAVCAATQIQQKQHT